MRNLPASPRLSGWNPSRGPARSRVLAALFGSRGLRASVRPARRSVSGRTAPPPAADLSELPPKPLRTPGDPKRAVRIWANERMDTYSLSAAIRSCLLNTKFLLSFKKGRTASSRSACPCSPRLPKFAHRGRTSCSEPRWERDISPLRSA